METSRLVGEGYGRQKQSSITRAVKDRHYYMKEASQVVGAVFDRPKNTDLSEKVVIEKSINATKGRQSLLFLYGSPESREIFRVVI